MLITGPQPTLDTLTAEDISIVADLADLPPGGHQVALQAIVNREGLETAVISVLPAVLDVEISSSVPETPPATPSSPEPTAIPTGNEGIIIPGSSPTYTSPN